MDYDKYFEGPNVSVVDEYYNEILKDCSGKYMFISKRRVKWFLLSMVHLRDCTLTYSKLWLPEIKDKLLTGLEKLSQKFMHDLEFDCPHRCGEDEPAIHTSQSECLGQIIGEKMDEYVKGIRCEFDIALSRSSWCKCGYENYTDTVPEMSDAMADELAMYCYNGERTNKQSPNMIYRYKKEWCSDYFVGKLVEKFTLKIMLYDKLLLNINSEVFGSHFDSSPMSSLDEDVEDYLNKQKKNIVKIVGKKAADRLDSIRSQLCKCSHINLTIFDVYRMFYIFNN